MSEHRDGLRARHGKSTRVGTGSLGYSVEVPPPAETSAGVPAPLPAPSGPVQRREGGQVTPEGARKLGALGGAAKARKAGLANDLVRTLCLGDQGHSIFKHRDVMTPFVREAKAFLAARVEEVARMSGGGEVSAGVIAIVRTATLQTYASRLLFEMGFGGMLIATTPKVKINDGLFATASRLGDGARQNFLAAHHLARIEAQARDARAPLDALPPGFVDDAHDDDGEADE